MKIVKIISLLILIFSYLYFSYIRFYHFIGGIDLKSPFLVNTVLIENTQGKDSAKYVALGDSLSAGVGASNFKETLPYFFSLHLSGKYRQVNLLNLAWPGATTDEVIQSQLAPVVAYKPDFITLLIGVNDLHNKVKLKKFENNYKFIFGELYNKTNARIVVINIPYIGSNKIVYFPYNILLNIRTKQFNEVIDGVVKEFGKNDRIKFVDLYSASYLPFKQELNYYSSDLFHPSSEGYKLWGNVINAD